MAVRKFTFGPGSLESIELTMYRDHTAGAVRARVAGWFSFYCGEGETHTELIDIRHAYTFSGCEHCQAHLTRIFMGDPDGARLVHAYTEQALCLLDRGTATVSIARRAYDGDQDAQAEIAHELISWWAEEHYEDPCQDYEREEDYAET